MKILFLAVLIIFMSFFDGCGRTESAVRKDKEIATKIQKHYMENFGMPGYKTTWYTPAEIEVIRDHVKVKTNIYPDKEGKEYFGSHICSAILGILYDKSDPGIDSLKAVEIEGQNDHPLARCQKP